MQEFNDICYRHLCAAIILQACKDYLSKESVKDRSSARLYFLSPRYEFHASYLHFKVTGKELLDILDSGKIDIKSLHYENGKSDTYG